MTSNQAWLDQWPMDHTRDPYSVPLDEFNVGHPALFKNNVHWDYFKRLREEAPVHRCERSQYGAYWSVTKYKDIMYVDTHHDLFSSDSRIGGISIFSRPDPNPAYHMPMFIQMDPPKHDAQRKVVQPVVAPMNLAKLENTIRERAGNILDALPINEEFNWVEKVSVELTGRMLATLFGIPQEDRYKLIRWSDVAGNIGNPEVVESPKAGFDVLFECLEYFTEVWNQRVNQPPGEDMDLISMLAHGESTRNMDKMEYLGNLILLIVGGNDTTRNSISGGLLALNEHPGQYDKLRRNPDVIPTMVPEIIRWQTPLAHMARTATQDTELDGQQINKGDKVVMWYVSGNRDAEVIDNPDEFIIDRERPRNHLSFGYGIHRCLGNRLAEMQLRVLWEEIMKRFDNIEVVGDPVRVNSCFIKGIETLPVEISA